jgi:hypothetical protein
MNFFRWNFGYHEAFHTNFFFFHDGILAITKPFARTFSFFTIEFWVSRSRSHELFLFSQWNSGYHEAFHMNSFFFHDGILAITKPFMRTLSFSRWNFGYHEAFHTTFFFFHDGILAITKPFHEFFFHMVEISAITEPFHKVFFHTVESRLSRSLFTNCFFTQWNIGYHRAFSQIFLSHGGIHKMHDLGEDSFHIYHKEYLHRTRIVKNLAS